MGQPCRSLARAASTIDKAIEEPLIRAYKPLLRAEITPTGHIARVKELAELGFGMGSVPAGNGLPQLHKFPLQLLPYTLQAAPLEACAGDFARDGHRCGQRRLAPYLAAQRRA